MKRQSTTDVKRAAANDKPENGTTKTTKAVKRTKPADDAKYVIGSVETVRRGFLLGMVEFAKAKGTVDHATLVKEFGGRQFDGRKVDSARITRYLGYCRNHGIFKTVKAGGQ
jgi:hypothetical protein